LHFQCGGFLAHYAAMQQPIDYSGRADSTEVHPGGSQQSAGAPMGGEIQLGQQVTTKPVEIGGRDGPEPTRFGDWEKSGRCIDF
jgi:hypothetical protein